MTWWQTIPTFAATLAVFFGPGLLILAAGGVRRLNLLALSAPVSFSVSACTAVAAPFVHLPFNPAVYFAVSLVLAAAVFTVRLLWLRKNSADRHPLTRVGLSGNGPLSPLDLGRWTAMLAVPAALLFSGFVIARRYILGFGGPENISQTFDNIYHLNAIKHIAETANGSSLTLGNLTEASQTFYPAAMHDSMALVFMLAGSVPVAVNVGSIVIGAIVWPLSCLFLISRVVGYRPVPLLVTGALAAGFSAFPYLMVGFGVLYPNHSAIALLPAVLGLTIEVLGMARSAPASIWPASWALLAVVPGLALTHPSTLIGMLGFAAPVVLARLVKEIRVHNADKTERKAVIFWSVFSAVYLFALATTWIMLRPSLSAAPWAPFQSNARAIGEVLASAPMGTTVAWVLTPLTVIGLYVLARHLRTMWWILAMYAIGGVLYIVVSSWSPGAFRTLLTGVWYNDSFRLAALLPAVTLPVAVLGAEWLVWRLRALLVRLHDWTRPKSLAKLVPAAAPVLGTWALVLLMAVGSQGGTLSNVQERIHQIFLSTPSSDLLDSDERELLDRVPDYVPDDEAVVANPLMGGALVYALADRDTIAPHVFGERTETERLVLEHWDEAAYNSRVCPAIDELKAYWALDFGDKTVIPSDDPFVGLNDLIDDKAPGVELVTQVGKARLFKITACD